MKMDDPESKWEIQEYNYSDEDEATVVRWILTIGREMVITGITISSAQLALPPLVVFSAMGLSFGVLYATYACTTKILTFLLPIPPSPSMPPMLLDINFQRVLDGQLEEGINELGVETEVVFQLDDNYYTPQGPSLIANADEMEIETEIETKPSFEDGDHSLEEEHKGNERLVENSDYELEEKFRDQGRVDNMVEDGHFVGGSASNVVFGDVEDVESASDVVFGDTKDENLLYERSMDNNLENFEDFDGVVDDQGYEEDIGKYLEGDDNDLHEERKAKEPLVEGWNHKNESNTQEVDEHAKLRDQGWVGNTIEIDCVVGGSASIVDPGDVRDVETTKPVTVEVTESHKLVEVGNTNKEQLSEMHHTLNLCDENNLNSSEVYTLDPVAREVVVGADKGERTIKFDEQVVARSCPSKDGSEDAILRTMEEHLIHSNAEARVIGGERSTNNMGSLEGYEEDAGEDDGLEEEQKGKQPLVESWNNDNAKLRDERRVDTEDDHKTVGGSSSDVVLGDVKDVETTKPVTAKHADSQKPVEVANKTEEHVCELRHTVVLSDENNLSSREVYTLDLAAREVIRDADKDERNIKFDETVVTKSCASTDGSEYTVLRTIEEHLIHSVEDARAIGEESLLDERKTNKLESLEVSYEVKENVVDDNVDAFVRSPSERDIDNGNKVKENAGDDDVNVLARSPSKRDTVNAKVVYKKMPSREENLDVDDEKIWEKIHAMKTIVGYDSPSQSTCIGELKALYVFTGVEPPASFEGDSDLDAKLKFLMTIVGVK